MDSPIRILLVEDNAADAELAARELRRAGVQFATRRVDTEDAFRGALAEELPDIILADYRMPAFDGLIALRIARQVAPGVPFIFLSGSLGEERAVEALREGATDYILKDRPSRLPAAVARAIRERDEQAARERAEAAVAESERRFRYAALATRDVIWDYDLAAGDLTPSWEETIHPDDRTRVMESFREWLQSGEERWTSEYRVRRAGGSYGHVVQRALVLRDGAGKPCRVIGAMQDVTETQRLRDQLDRAERVDSLGRLAATIAHEFNNVLMSIQPVGEVINRNDDDRVARLGTKIIDCVGRGRRIVDEILRMTRVPEPVPEIVDVVALVSDIEAEDIGGGGIRIAVDAPSHPVWIRCDRSQFQQVLMNLAVNARDAMPGGGTLTFRVQQIDGKTILSVSDTGVGIPQDIVERIFEPLFTTKRTGTGLGLAVCHRLLTQNGATIAVDSVVGRGTTFQITFPVADADGAPAAKPQAVSPRSFSPKRILLIEDNPDVAEGIRMLLDSEGFEIHVVDSGSSGVDAVGSWRPDAVLLDMSLPDMDGTEVFDRLIAQRPELPIVITSGHMDLAGLGDRIGRANVAFLRKPFGFDALLTVLDRISRAAVSSFPTDGGRIVTADG